jgi:hypothetical protein
MIPGALRQAGRQAAGDHESLGNMHALPQYRQGTIWRGSQINPDRHVMNFGLITRLDPDVPGTGAPRSR